MSIQDIALDYGPDYNNLLAHAGYGVGVAYSNWDKSSIMLCNCDQRYFGADCSLRN